MRFISLWLDPDDRSLYLRVVDSTDRVRDIPLDERDVLQLLREGSDQLLTLQTLRHRDEKAG